MTPGQVKTFRTTLGLSQSQFATRINGIDPKLRTSVTTVSRWETGTRSPSIHAQAAMDLIAAQEGIPSPDAAPEHADRDAAIQAVQRDAFLRSSDPEIRLDLTEDEQIQTWRDVVANCDRSIAMGGDGGFSPSTAEAIKRVAVMTLRNTYGVEVGPPPDAQVE